MAGESGGSEVSGFSLHTDISPPCEISFRHLKRRSAKHVYFDPAAVITLTEWV